MKKIINYCFLVLSLLSINITINALTYGGCEYSEISRLKSVVSNINISYDYYIRDNKAYFDITINNLVPEIYFVDSKTRKKYTYDNSVDGEIIIYGNTFTSGHYDFYVALSKCYGVKLENKYYNLPTYNYYYTEPLCQENPNFGLCKKWLKVNFSFEELKKSIEEYKDNINNEEEIVAIYEDTILDKIVKFYIKNYYFILICIIVICTSIMLIYKRKNRFDL